MKIVNLIEWPEMLPKLRSKLFSLIVLSCITLLAACSKNDVKESSPEVNSSGSKGLAKVAAYTGQVGYCNVNGLTTGGAGGQTVTVTNYQDFSTYATSASPYIIKVSGTITFDYKVKVAPNKTIQGVNASATIVGNLDLGGQNNIIISNLKITNPTGDGITLNTSHHIWVDHCAIYDCSDGLCDISGASDYVTVSYCKFYYVNQQDHRFTMVLGNSVDGLGKLRVTLCNNWWAERCDQRMPAGSYSLAHIYNNYFSSTGNSYSTNARTGAKWYVENNYYDKVNSPCYTDDTGIMKTIGNIYNQCTGNITPGTGSVAAPPYAYSLISTANVPSTIISQAGPKAVPTFNPSVNPSAIVSGATYSFISQNAPGKGFDVANQSTSNGALIQLYNYIGTGNQKFIINDIGGGYYNIVNVNSGKCVDVKDFSTSNGGIIHQYTYANTTNQHWSIQSVGNGYFKIINRNSGKCIDVKDLSTSNGGTIHQYTYSGTSNQHWQLNKLN